MGNVTHILPVLHCLKRGIAFVSSYFVVHLRKISLGFSLNPAYVSRLINVQLVKWHINYLSRCKQILRQARFPLPELTARVDG